MQSYGTAAPRIGSFAPGKPKGLIGRRLAMPKVSIPKPSSAAKRY